MKRAAFPLILALSLPVSAATPPQTTDLSNQKSVAVTIYNQNLGLIKDVRKLKLGAGRFDLRFMDVASGIDPTSVAFKSLSAPQAVSILEQNYEYDLITPQRLMEKHLNKEIDIQQTSGVQHATLLSTNEGYVYKIGDRIHLQPPGQVILPKLPENLVSRPTLVWSLNNEKAQEHTVEATYLTSGLNWNANYVLESDKDNTRVDLTGWVTLANNSGADYRNADLTLVAGDLNRVREKERSIVFDSRAGATAESNFQEDPLFEYHSYHLQYPTTLKDRQTKQVALLDAKNIPVTKRFIFQPNISPCWSHSSEHWKNKIAVMLDFENRRKSNLGMPLPKGVMRVYQDDNRSQLQFIGEDRIDHTPKDEKVRIKLGEAFDVVADQWQTNYRKLGEHLYETSYKVSIRNHKASPVTVTTIEKLGGDWTITNHSQDFRKIDSTTAEFEVPVPANEEKILTYTVRTIY